MTRWQFHALNATCLVLVLTIGLQYWLGQRVQALNIQALRAQNIVSNARQVEPVLRRMSMRIAELSDTEPALRDLLIKYGMKVTLNVDGKQKNYP
ncbi:MAG: hypothetical protein HY360_17840 [Verrucomicrobia bacterium]|nr:hypothetical protein [Verrucomicrobiota bacterium]